jgi:hypothetical protein
MTNAPRVGDAPAQTVARADPAANNGAETPSSEKAETETNERSVDSYDRADREETRQATQTPDRATFAPKPDAPADGCKQPGINLQSVSINRANESASNQPIDDQSPSAKAAATANRRRAEMIALGIKAWARTEDEQATATTEPSDQSRTVRYEGTAIEDAIYAYFTTQEPKELDALSEREHELMDKVLAETLSRYHARRAAESRGSK